MPAGPGQRKHPVIRYFSFGRLDFLVLLHQGKRTEDASRQKVEKEDSK
jgi:hypothetical protein